VSKREFGKLPDGRSVKLFVLKNENGITAEIIEYGASIVSLKVPDRNGNLEDVLLGYESLNDYLYDPFFIGCIVGRCGGRIKNGRFSLSGSEYQLPINDGPHHLHGGPRGFYKLLWKGDIEPEHEGSAVTFRIVSPDGDQGYPGELSLNVTYSLNDQNELCINYTGLTDKETILNPTNHAYFNLSANPRTDILDHVLMIKSEFITEINHENIPTGKKIKVVNTPFDFHKAKVIRTDINTEDVQLKNGNGYDHAWILDDYNGKIQSVASLYHPKSGRFMEVYSDQPVVQFYSGNFLDGSAKGKNGIDYQFRCGLCLETQHFADAPNRPEFPSIVLHPGEQYRQTTKYKFSLK
jgi:aldose 1-epimerase